MLFKLVKGTFFFDQKIVQNRKRRKRKRPDELPKSIRFASLNPKLAAFLANHDRQKSKRFLEGTDIGDGDNSLAALETGSGSFLPNIHADYLLKLLRGNNDNLIYERDKPQRQRYHAAVSCAPALIVQLRRLLYLFKTEHLDLPGELVNDLQSGFPELISEARYTTPEWQCIENVQDGDEDGEDKHSEDIFDLDGLTGDEVVEETEEQQDAQGGEKKKKKKRKAALEPPQLILPKNNGGGSSRARSRKLPSALSDKPKSGRRSTIVGKDGNLLPKMALLGKNEDNLSSRATETPQSHCHEKGIHQPSFLQVISFSMTLKSCEDKGWIVKQSDETEDQQRNLIELLLQRLQQSSRQARSAAEEAKARGHDNPLMMRFYGDSKKAAMTKYMMMGRKSSSKLVGKVPKLPPNTLETENRFKFLTSLPDGTSTTFYRSGNVAVSVTNASGGRPGHYTLVYADDDERTLLALFTPAGKGSCYHQNGKIRFCATDKGCIIMDVDGTATSRFTWPLPHCKLDVPITIPISNYLSLRVLNFNQMTLTFEAYKEVARFNVGAHLMAVEPQTQEELGYIETAEEFTSVAAKDAIRPPVSLSKKKKVPTATLR